MKKERDSLEPNIESVWKGIQNVAYLENIRILFDYMQELNYRYRESIGGKQSYSGYLGNGGLDYRAKLLEKLQKHIQEITSECLAPNQSSDASKPKLLYQHPLSSYLSFYLKLFPSQEPEKDLTPMLNYFNILQYLTDEEFAPNRENPDYHAALPYLYEDLCLSIREMTNCHACFLLYQEKGEITELIARSGYVIDDEEGALSNFNIRVPELDSIVRQCSFLNDISYSVSQQTISSSNLTFSINAELVEGIKLIRGVNESAHDGVLFVHKYLVFEIPYFQEGRQEENGRNFYLLLDYREKDGVNQFTIDEAKKPTLKVLFLRKRLWEALRRDYAELIDYRFDCSYIKPFRSEKAPTIMHISDSHLADDGSWTRSSERSKMLCQHLETEQHGKIDLLAVTGDIVLASHHASEAQAKYHRIEQLLQSIAICLWATKSDSTGVQILPHDWKRRIMIITGNHDYAAMNDVLVQTGGRKIKNAGPAGHSGGTMSKFAYYIEFLINFLDIPVDELLENDLNEIRDYKYLGLTVAMINTSSKANSLQNNKVAINGEKIHRLKQQVPWHDTNQKRTHIALMHHSPSYNIDYFRDKYEIHKYTRAGILSEEIYGRYIDLLNSFIRQEIEIPVTGMASNTIKEIQECLAAQNDEKFMRSELKSDMAMLVNILIGSAPKDEFYYDFRSKNLNLLEIQAEDQEEFDRACQDLFGIGKTIIFAGHVHKNQYHEYVPDASGKINPVFIIDKLCVDAEKTMKKLSYLVVRLSANSASQTATVYKIPQDISQIALCPCPCSKFVSGSCNEKCFDNPTSM